MTFRRSKHPEVLLDRFVFPSFAEIVYFVFGVEGMMGSSSLLDVAVVGVEWIVV